MQDYRLTELDNGLRIISETLPDVRSISIGYWIDTGSRDEADNEAGVSHLLEHLLFKGTERFDATKIAESFDSIGAEINAFTSKENTVLHCRFLDQHLDMAFDISSDMLLNPVYRELDVEREVVLEEIAMYEDEPQDKVHDIFASSLFGSHPLGRPVIGTLEAIQNATKESLSSYHSSHYSPDKIVISAAGNIEHKRLVEMASKLQTGPCSDSNKEKPLLDLREYEPQAMFIQKDTDQSHVCIGGPGIPRSDDRRYAMGILDTIFGGSVSSRLFQEVREKRGLAYAIYSFNEQFCDTGDVGIYVGTRPENLVEVLSIISTEIKRLRENPATDAELARAKESAKGRFVLSMEMTQARMNRLGRSLIGEVEIHTLDEIISIIDAIDTAALSDIAEQLYNPDRFCVAGIGSDEEVFWKAVRPINDVIGAPC